MKKMLALLVGVIVSVCAFSVSAEAYSMVFPAYVPVSGGAWCEVATSQGRLCVVVPVDYRTGHFGFSGDGYNVTNVTDATISGTAYAQTNFSYYGNPTSLQCRFTRMNTLEVYEPYRNTSGYTSYRWTSLPTSAIYNTNMGFIDDTGLGRQNDNFLYEPSQKLLILNFVAIAFIAFFLILRRMWSA